jgi:hypothetical protein
MTPDPGCARCGWLEREHGVSRFACRQFQTPSSEFAVELRKALAAVYARRN